MYRFPYTLVCLVLVILIVCVRTLVNSKLCAELLLRCTWWSVNDHFQFAHKWIFVHLHIEILVFCTSFVWSWSFSTIALLYQLDIFCVQDMGNTRNIQSILSRIIQMRNTVFLLPLLSLLRCRMAILPSLRWNLIEKMPCEKIHTHSTQTNDIIVICSSDRVNWFLFHSRVKWAKGVTRVL